MRLHMAYLNGPQMRDYKQIMIVFRCFRATKLLHGFRGLVILHKVIK